MEIVHDFSAEAPLDIATRPIPWPMRIWGNSTFRRSLVVAILAAAWQAYAVWLDNPLMVPTLSDTFVAFVNGMISGEIPSRMFVSLKVLMMGYVIGLLLAFILVGFAAVSQFGASLLETLTAMLMPLPAIVLLPLAMLWFGFGNGSMIFVLLHSVTWAIAANTHAGFGAVSETLRMVGRNCGLRGVGYVWRILIPAAFPSILAGLKVGWAFGWRTLVAAELIFGTNSSSGGLGWYIYINKNQLDITNVFAGLLAVIFIGLFIDSFVFRTVERLTVRRWGMQA